MKCPLCNCRDSRVLDSRPIDEGSSIKRRRECPACGKRNELSADYLTLSDGAQQALCVCPDHGLFTVRIKFQKDDKGRRVMVRSCALSEEQSPAYISTKIIQWQNKLSAQRAAQEAQKEAEVE